MEKVEARHKKEDESRELVSDNVHISRASNLVINIKVLQMKKEGKKVYHLGFGQSPFPVPAAAVKILAEHSSANTYLPTEGILPLRSSVCKFHARHDGLDYFEPDDVVVGVGSKMLLFLLFAVFDGDVLLLAPTWVTYKPQTDLANKRSVIMRARKEDDWKLTPELLEKTLKENNVSKNKLLVFCNPDNPTGVSYSRSEVEKLSHAFRKHDVIVISDEIYGRINFTDSHTSVCEFYPEKTILMSGLSKWSSAGGWRVGYSMFPKALHGLRRAVISAGSHTYSSVSSPVQYASIKLLSDDDDCKEYIAHTKRILAAVGMYCHRTLLSVGVTSPVPGGGYYLFPDFEVLRGTLEARGIKTGWQMCDAIFEEAKVAIMPAGPDFLRSETELMTRLCFVGFEGGAALDASEKLGLDKPIGDEFLQKYCTNVFEGIKALVAWVKQQQS